ncbi:hypothetical protein JCM11491_001140 [Sporobolomyces phaffii]
MDPLGLASPTSTTRTNATVSSLVSFALAPATATLASVHPAAAVTRLGLESSPLSDPVVRVLTTTVFAIVHATSPAPAASPSSSLGSTHPSSSSSSSSSLENLASGREYSGYSFFGLATIAISTLLTILVVCTAFACVLVQSERMKRVLQDAEDAGSDGDGDGASRYSEVDLDAVESGEGTRERLKAAAAGPSRSDAGEKRRLLRDRGESCSQDRPESKVLI